MIWRKACYRRISSFYCALKAHLKESSFHSGLLFYASIACFYFYSWCCKFRIWKSLYSFILRCQSGKSSLKTDKGEGRCLLRLIEETNYCICDSISSFSPCQLSQMYEPLDSSICWDKDKLTPSFLITKPISKCYTICLAAALVKRTARTVVPTKNAIPWGDLYSGSPSWTTFDGCFYYFLHTTQSELMSACSSIEGSPKSSDIDTRGDYILDY